MKKLFLSLVFCSIGFAGYLSASCVTSIDTEKGTSQTNSYKDGASEHFVFADGKLICIF